MISKEELIIIGKFQKTHALKGELNMILDIDPQYLLDGHPLIVNYEGIWVPYFVETIRPKGSTSYLVKISGVENEEAASKFVNKEIGILKKDAEEWLDEEILDTHELAGYSIIDNEDDTLIGKIIDVEDSTSNLLFIVEDSEGDIIYIPANEDLIHKIDDEGKEIRMNLPSGLIEMNKKSSNDV